MADNTGWLTFEQTRKIRSLSLDKAELRKLLDRLEERSLAAGEREARRFVPRPDMTPEQADNARQQIRDGHKLRVRVEGEDGGRLDGSIREVFESPNFPDGVRTALFDSSMPLRVIHNYAVANTVKVYLDFSRPAVLDFTLLPSFETPNASEFSVNGEDATWVNGVAHEFDDFMRTQPSAAGWLHRHSVYDALVWPFAFPMGIWFAYRLSGRIERIPSPFIRAGLYVFVTYLSLVAFRVMFHYARWIWPRIEFRHPRDRALRHRLAWGTLVVAVACSAAWDLLKWLAR